jgi:outer membrane protein OmpA-like peptidoglycan-associated protein
MKATEAFKSFPGQLALVALASALVIPAGAQQNSAPPQGQSAPPAAQQTTDNTAVGSQSTGPDVNQQRLQNAHKEGFWGHLQPFARKKWVHRQTQPINDRLTELDEVNAKNAKDIQDVDARAQAGIHQAQSTAEAANQAATAAGAKAEQASTVAQGASGKVDQINTTVSGLDQYKPVSEVDVPFRGGSPILTSAAKQNLDQIVSGVQGRQGYIIEVEAHSPARGAAGIANSQRFAAVVSRYLVEHDIPVYRVHSVALGNAPMEVAANDQAANSNGEATPQRIRTSSVHIRVMENSLAAQGAASPQGVAPATGAERP